MKWNKKFSWNKKIILVQVIILVIVFAGIYLLYPRSEVNVNGNFVNFKSINAKVVMVSENPDFTNPRYLDFRERENYTFNLKPGTYYWKSSNSLISGLKNKFTIQSEVGLGINRTEEDANLVNLGNVKINVTKNKEGVMVGHIILDPEEQEKIEDKGTYEGRQENGI
jgi:hypothetical protein